MIQKKICMLGTSAVGKTSLVRRYVRSIFDDSYLTTIGVKIDKKILEVEGSPVTLMLWDLEGEDEFQKLRSSYLRGLSGFFLVADGTRAETLPMAMSLCQRVLDEFGELPFILLLNKYDLHNLWEIKRLDVQELEGSGLEIRNTSAKTGEGVEAAFYDLASMILSKKI